MNLTAHAYRKRVFSTVVMPTVALVWCVAFGSPTFGEAIECSVSGPNGRIADVTVRVTVLIPDRSAAPVEPTDNASRETAARQPLRTMRVLEETTFRTDADGRYQLVLPDLDLPDLKIRMSAEHPEHLMREMRLTTIEELHKHPRSTHRNMLLKRAYKMRGRVLQPDGKPAAEAKVFAQSKYRAYSWKFRDPGEYIVSSSTTTDREGRFEVMTDDLITLRVLMKGAAVLLVDKVDAKKQAAPNTERDFATFTLPKSKTVRGRVVDFADKPIPFGIVTAARHFAGDERNMPLAYEVSAVTNENGEYELPPLAADTYKLSVTNRVANASAAQSWNERTSLRPVKHPFYNRIPLPSGKGHTEPIEMIPIEGISVRKIIDVLEELTIVNFSPKDNLKVNVRVINGNAQQAPYQLRILGQTWRGRSVAISDDNPVTLYVPHGIRDAFIDTGPILFRRGGKEQPLMIGQSIPLGMLEHDVDDIVIVRPELVEFKVHVNLPDEFLQRKRFGAAFDFAVSYARIGFRKHWRARQKLYVPSKKISDNLLHGTGMVGEEIVFQVKSRLGRRPTLLHEERFTLTSQKENQIEIDLSKLQLEPPTDPKDVQPK